MSVHVHRIKWIEYICNLILIRSIFSEGRWRLATIDQGSKLIMLLNFFSPFILYFWFFFPSLVFLFLGQKGRIIINFMRWTLMMNFIKNGLSSSFIVHLTENGTFPKYHKASSQMKRKMQMKNHQNEIFILIGGSVVISNFFIHSIRNNAQWTHSMSPNKQRKSHRLTWKPRFCFILQIYWNDPDIQYAIELKIVKEEQNKDDCDVIWYIKHKVHLCIRNWENCLVYRNWWKMNVRVALTSFGIWLCRERDSLCVYMREYSEYINSNTNNQENQITLQTFPIRLILLYIHILGLTLPTKTKISQRREYST